VASKSAARKKMIEEKRAEEPQPSYVIRVKGTTEEAKKDLWKKVTKRNKTPRMSIVIGRSGKTILKPQNKETADTLRSLVSKGLVTEEMPLWSRIIISGVAANFEAEEALSALCDQNPELELDGGTDKKIRFLFKKGARERETVSWVAEVDPAIYERVCEATIYIGFMGRGRLRRSLSASLA